MATRRELAKGCASVRNNRRGVARAGLSRGGNRSSWAITSDLTDAGYDVCREERDRGNRRRNPDPRAHDSILPQEEEPSRGATAAGH